MFKNVGLVIFFYMFLNPSFEMTTSYANIARTTVGTSKFIYILQKISIHQELGLYMKNFNLIN